MRKRQVNSDSEQQRLLLTVDEAAQVLSLSRSLMYALLMSEQVISFKIGRVRRVHVSALQAYVDRQVSQAS